MSHLGSFREFKDKYPYFIDKHLKLFEYHYTVYAIIDMSNSKLYHSENISIHSDTDECRNELIGFLDKYFGIHLSFSEDRGYNICHESKSVRVKPLKLQYRNDIEVSGPVNTVLIIDMEHRYVQLLDHETFEVLYKMTVQDALNFETVMYQNNDYMVKFSAIPYLSGPTIPSDRIRHYYGIRVNYKTLHYISTFIYRELFPYSMKDKFNVLLNVLFNRNIVIGIQTHIKQRMQQVKLEVTNKDESVLRLDWNIINNFISDDFDILHPDLPYPKYIDRIEDNFDKIFFIEKIK